MELEEAQSSFLETEPQEEPQTSVQWGRSRKPPGLPVTRQALLVPAPPPAATKNLQVNIPNPTAGLALESPVFPSKGCWYQATHKPGSCVSLCALEAMNSGP